MQLAKRGQRRDEASKGLEAAKESGTAAEVEQYERRLVKVTPEHSSECKRVRSLRARAARRCS